MVDCFATLAMTVKTNPRVIARNEVTTVKPDPRVIARNEVTKQSRKVRNNPVNLNTKPRLTAGLCVIGGDRGG